MLKILDRITIRIRRVRKNQLKKLTSEPYVTHEELVEQE
jgi:hypothetical protein